MYININCINKYMYIYININTTKLKGFITKEFKTTKINIILNYRSLFIDNCVIIRLQGKKQ